MAENQQQQQAAPPSVASIGKDPSFPLPLIPQAQLDAQYAQERAAHFARLVSVERAIPLPGYLGVNVEDSEQFQTLVKKVQAYEKEALRSSEANQDYLSFIPTGDLAAAGLADHLHLQQVLGIKDTRNVTADLSATQKEKVADDLVSESRTIDRDEDFLRVAMQGALGAQEAFIGHARKLSSYLSGVVVSDLEQKIKSSEKDRKEIEDKIARATRIASKVEGTIKLAVAIVTFNPEEAMESIATVGEKVKDLAGGSEESGGFLAKIVSHFEHMKWDEKLHAIENTIREAEMMKDVAGQVKASQEYESMVALLRASLTTLKTQVQQAALYARTLTDRMRSKPKHQKGQGKAAQNARAAADAADAKDPVKRVEIFVTSALATNVLLDGGVAAATRASASLTARMQSSFGERLAVYWSGNRGAWQEYDRESVAYNKMTNDAESQLHSDEGVAAPDMQMLASMSGFTSMWVVEAERQKKRVQEVADQAKTMMAG